MSSKNISHTSIQVTAINQKILKTD